MTWMWLPIFVSWFIIGLYPFRSPDRASFTLTVELVSCASAAGWTIFKVGAALSCSPRSATCAAIRCGWPTFVSVCGVLAGVAFALFAAVFEAFEVFVATFEVPPHAANSKDAAIAAELKYFIINCIKWRR